MVKFPIVGGIGVLKGNQQELCDIYEAVNKPSNFHHLNNIEVSNSTMRTHPPKMIMIRSIEVKIDEVFKFDELDPKEPMTEQHGAPI